MSLAKSADFEVGMFNALRLRRIAWQRLVRGLYGVILIIMKELAIVGKCWTYDSPPNFV